MPYGTVNTDRLVSSDGGVIGPNITSLRNRIINGAMVIDQRNAGASVATSSGSVGYSLDRWALNYSQTSKFTVQQNANAVTLPSGYTNYLGAVSSSAYAVLAGDFFMINQRIEGFNSADLGWGTANAQAVTLSFKVYSSLTGTFGGAVFNSAQNRSYPFTYSIPTANTWTTISITIAGDTSGTWLTTNGIGLFVNFGIGVGTTYSGTAGSWAGATYFSATGATSVVGTNGATFYITGVQLEVGTVATSFDYRSIGTETALCQRYFAKTYDTATVPGTATAVGAIATNVNGTWAYAPSGTWCFPVAMRAQPTVVLYSTQNANTTGVSTADATDGAATTICLGLSAVSIRRNNNSSGVSSGADIKSQATASAEL
jgi:hypothetical protein